jgi:glycosyltransferase involved in cell wall biosynthesis
MNSVLVIAPCCPGKLPTQGFFIADELRKAGFRVGIITKARSGFGRLLDVAFRCVTLFFRYDSVFVNVYGDRAFIYESLAVFSARVLKRRIVLLIHNGQMVEFVRHWPGWTHFVFSQADLILVPHRFLYDQLSSLGLHIDGTIPNFIDVNRYRFRERSSLSPRFLYLRGMYPYYNPQMAIRAFALIQNEHPDASLTLAGEEGKESTTCRRLVSDLNLRNVTFVGMVPNDQIPMLAEQHDIHLHTSRVENMPVTVIEMWACGLPIVGTDVGGMPYLIRNWIDGILVRSEDHHAMADACLKLLCNPELARTFSRNGRSRAEELSWEKIKPLWEKALLLDDGCEKFSANH